MKVTKQSKLSGRVHSMELDVTDVELKRWHEGEYIQHVFPNLNSNEREFLITGITADEWDAAFGFD